MKTNLSLASKVLLAFTLPLGLAYFFLVIPQMRATTQALADVDALRQSNSAVTTVKQRDDFKQKIADLRTEANKLLPATDQQYDLSVQVEDLAKSKNLTIGALTVNAAQPTNLHPTTAADGGTSDAGNSTVRAADVPATTAALKVTVTVSVTGAYTDIEHFVAALPTLDRFVQIDQLALTGGADGALTAQLTAFAYYLPAAH